MKYDIQNAKTLMALSELTEALAECRHEESHEGEKISVKEFIEIVLPKYHEAVGAFKLLYKELIIEYSKDNEVLASKCVECEFYTKNECEMFSRLDIDDWDKFVQFSEKNNGMCVVPDFDKKLAEGFHLEDGTLVGLKG